MKEGSTTSLLIDFSCVFSHIFNERKDVHAICFRTDDVRDARTLDHRGCPEADVWPTYNTELCKGNFKLPRHYMRILPYEENEESSDGQFRFCMKNIENSRLPTIKNNCRQQRPRAAPAGVFFNFEYNNYFTIQYAGVHVHKRSTLNGFSLQRQPIF